MQIPNGVEVDGTPAPTLSASQLRTYGVPVMDDDGLEAARGCPRKYKAHYIDKTGGDENSYPLRYGSMLHDVFYRMERDGSNPVEALTAAWDPELPRTAWDEASADLDRYMSRGASPMDRGQAIAVELHLSALLYIDEDFGPIYYQGYVDWLGWDGEVANQLWVVDYKTNRTPPKEVDLDGDIQMPGYVWLVLQQWERWSRVRPNIVATFDAIKYRPISVKYTADDIDRWQAWAEATARRILRDNDATPKLNTSCSTCPVRVDCPAVASLPDDAALIAAADRTAMTFDDLVAWRDRANAARLTLAKLVAAADVDIQAIVETQGEQWTTTHRFTMDEGETTIVDLARLHSLLGDRFYEVIRAGKGRVQEVTRDMPADVAVAALGCFQSVPSGMRVHKVKAGVARDE